MKKRLTTFILITALLSLCACGSPEVASGRIGAPFSGDAEWEWDVNRVEAEMGKCAEPYVSIYNGTTYSYPLSWQDREGIIKFMFSGEGKLASVAWTFLTDSEEEVNAVITAARQIETEKNGKNDNLTQGTGSSGTVWYTQDKDILLSSVAVNGSYGFQYSYISREFSKRDLAESR